MKPLRGWGIETGLALVFCLVVAPGYAAEAKRPQIEEEGAGGKIVKKAVRGGQNLAFGLVTDVARTIYYETRDRGPLYGFTVGLIKGLGLGGIRMAVGAYELFTFPLPVNDYEPLVLPAFPFEAGPTEAFPDSP